MAPLFPRPPCVTPGMSRLTAAVMALVLRTCVAEVLSGETESEAEAESEVSAPARRLAPWLQGVVAVLGFLLLVSLMFIINRVWCGDTREEAPAAVTADPAAEVEEEEAMERRQIERSSGRNDVGQHKAFENPTLENEDELLDSVETASTAF